MAHSQNYSTSVDARLAVLIDADNASVNHLDALLSEIATLGISSVRRAYGDWTRPQLNSWKNVLLSYSIQPIQQFSYTTGKNATDASLIIDAMDLLYTERFDGFYWCMVLVVATHPSLLCKPVTVLLILSFLRKTNPLRR